MSTSKCGDDGVVRIALLAPIWASVPPKKYGGVETVLAALADGLVDAGHDVTLFATGDSRTNTKLVCVVNNHLGPLAGALAANVSVPVVHTVSDPIDRGAGLWRSIQRFNPKLA